MNALLTIIILSLLNIFGLIFSLFLLIRNLHMGRMIEELWNKIKARSLNLSLTKVNSITSNGTGVGSGLTTVKSSRDVQFVRRMELLNVTATALTTLACVLCISNGTSQAAMEAEASSEIIVLLSNFSGILTALVILHIGLLNTKVINGFSVLTSLTPSHLRFIHGSIIALYFILCSLNTILTFIYFVPNSQVPCTLAYKVLSILTTPSRGFTLFFGVIILSFDNITAINLLRLVWIKITKRNAKGRIDFNSVLTRIICTLCVDWLGLAFVFFEVLQISNTNSAPTVALSIFYTLCTSTSLMAIHSCLLQTTYARMSTMITKTTTFNGGVGQLVFRNGVAKGVSSVDGVNNLSEMLSDREEVEHVGSKLSQILDADQ